jgi:glycosyltransferase involved in cell wall biosynthesis
MNEVDVSVIVPCRNAARFVREALESITAQTLQPREVLLADDGSSDDSIAVARSAHPGVRVLEGPFGGASGARNAALAQAEGALVAFLDADDRWAPLHLERALSLLSQGGDTAYLGHFDTLDGNGNRGSLATLPELKEPMVRLDLDTFLSFFRRGLPNGSASYVVRRAAAIEAGGFDPSQLRANDLDFWLRVVLSHRWCYDPRPSVFYRIRTSGNLSEDVASRSYYRLRAFLRAHERRQSGANQTLEHLIRYWAEQTLRTAVSHGTPNDWSEAFALASPHVSRWSRLQWTFLAHLRRALSPPIRRAGNI